MIRMIMSRFLIKSAWIAVACLAAVSTGCVPNPSAEFAWRDSTTDLIKDARSSLQNTVNENFGTPDDLVAWERLPVNYGGIKGTVAAAPEGTELTPGEFAFSHEGEGEVKPGDTVLWLSGEMAGKEATIQSADAATHLISLKAGTAPAEGTTFAVNFGDQLQLGRMVYMKNCLHCHGVAGDGAGPTAQYLNPRPRDYRLGVFKFTETLATERVTRDDLWRVIKYGIPGTYMPSFLLLDDHETTAVVEYVRWLAMRGELEKRLGDELTDYSQTSLTDQYNKAVESKKAAEAAGDKPEAVPSMSSLRNTAKDDFKEYAESDYADTVDSTADFIAENWTRADDPASVIHPAVARVADTPESRARGRLLYLSDRTKCYTCHGNTGRGNGGATEDFWPKPGSTEKYDARGLHDVWGNPLQPRNLRLGQYRGGRRPVDVFRRIYAGIKGTPMPAFGGTVLKDEEVWDVVNYVMSLPFESDASPSPAPSTKMAAHPVQ